MNKLFMVLFIVSISFGIMTIAYAIFQKQYKDALSIFIMILGLIMVSNSDNISQNVLNILGGLL